MIIKEFYCDKFMGTYIVNMSKKECERTDLRLECAYKRIDDKKYQITTFVGVESFDLLFEYMEDTIDSNYKNLKDNIKIYISSRINENTMDKLNDFIEKRVIPEPNYKWECVGKVYKIDGASGRKYCVTIYSNYIKIKNDRSFNMKIIEGKYTLDDVINIIKKEESLIGGQVK